MLSLNEINEHMEKLSGWDFDLTFLTKTFIFDDSAKVLIFLDKIMELSNDLNHHPEIIINHLKVQINLTTHSENAVTMKDFELAEAIDRTG